MAESYIGKSPQYGYFNKQILSAPINASVTLDRAAADTRQLIVVVGGVIQEPETSYSINAAGTTLTFTETPDTSSTGWIIWLGQLTTSPRVMPGSITAQTALGTSPAAADVFLMYDDDAGTLKKVAYSDLESDTAAMGANTVKVRDANASGVPSNKTVADTQLLIGDGTGFTAAALSGDVTMTNAGVVAIANNSIDSDHYVDGSIDNAHLAANSVDSDQYVDGSIDNAHLADNAVDSDELAASAVDIAHMSATGTASAATYLRGDNTWAVVAGDIEGVTASTGLSGGGTSGTVSVSLDTTNAQEWTGTQNFNSTSLTFDATQDWDLSLNQVCDLTLTANTTFDAPTNLVDGGFYSITIIQDGTGSRTASWNTVFKWAGGTAPTLTTTASAKDIFVFRSDGTNMLEVGRQLNVS